MDKFKDYITDKEEQLKKVKQDGYNIRFIKNPDKEAILYVLKKDVFNINDINISD